MVESRSVSAISIGLDDGYAYTKVALPDGRLSAIPSRGRIGRSNITWLNGSEQKVFEYETDGTVFAVGEVEAEPTHFDGYPFSALNRVIVQHALQQAGLAGKSLHAVSGLPVSSFYQQDGHQRTELIHRKTDSLRLPATPLASVPAAAIAFHEVIPEALAAWYDHVIQEDSDGVRLDSARLAEPMAIIDIGGRTTDFVVVVDQSVRHDSSGSLRCGLLDLKRRVAGVIRDRFGLEELSERAVDEALSSGSLRLFGKAHDVSAAIAEARHEIVARLHSETQRQLGRGAELERILFVGGGAIALADGIRDWFPNQTIAAHPSFANARGMLKYLRHVCQEPVGS